MKCIKCGKCCHRFEASLDMTNPANDQAIATIKKHFADGSMKMILKSYTAVKFVIEGCCQHYNEENGHCEIYKTRPEICKKFMCNDSLLRAWNDKLIHANFKEISLNTQNLNSS